MSALRGALADDERYGAPRLKFRGSLCSLTLLQRDMFPSKKNPQPCAAGLPVATRDCRCSNPGIEAQLTIFFFNLPWAF